ncbi:AAA family ATPase [Ethanoligenens harbinense]|uniref:AAA ATPase n=1 Tax=Ethanoligenens harbinense (strain DSM 18485 / JCM 12961 / CGMCC 1.5033 / YUAN-3) TaxID=663278 RepID=E6U5R2_ETHHY|nr:AAA family ATPase [Ethanoligenens harbinense]ADU26821.1 AAA ATPase [Ethanoligenens harbinense YUAN-3]AVQ95928.1 ABC transporter ATP-binding protein [Ethanoligenens harbinense YUAN-3]AYF38590.1 ABC transporter ATP-binding protein [Ethanoligenens harbinense]AYF41336.1 ABC transporter ATP-binding protein [Ethanoligenens harbinense]QCN92169.1 ABC transporter ATP-binding protein [Ethanoligenens harbinense]
MDSNYISSVKLTKPLPEGSYLNNLQAVRHLIHQGGLAFEKPVTFLVGENGTGKSTLLEGIAAAYGFNPEGGTRNFTFSTRATHSELYQYLTIARRAHAKDGFFLRAECFYNLASNIDDLGVEDSYGGRSLHAQSHGESFLALIENRFGGNGVYLLDEPEAALSPNRLMTLLARIHDLVQRHSQFLIATHSPILMAYPGAEVLELTADGIRAVNYQETEHYQLTRRFLENPERMFHYLLEENND